MISRSPVASPMPARTALPLPPLTGMRWTRTPGTADAISTVRSRRSVVDDDDLLVEAEWRQIDGEDPLEQRADEALLVVRGNDDRQRRAHVAARPSRGQIRFDGLQLLGRVDADGFHLVVRGKRDDVVAARWPRR